VQEEVSKVREWITGKKPGPLTIELLFGEGCNQNCKFCSNYNGKEGPLGRLNIKKGLSDSEYLRIIDECASLGVWKIQLSGEGEPLFDKKLAIPLMKKIKEKGMYGFLNTNGVLFNEKDIKELVELGWDKILFSIESPKAGTHDYLVSVKGSFDKAMHNTERFNYWRKKLGKEAPEMEFKMVLTNRNYNQIEDMVLLADKMNVHLRIDCLIVFHEYGKALSLNDSQKKEFGQNLKKALELHRKLVEKRGKSNELRFDISDELYNEVFSKTDAHFSRKKENKLAIFQFLKKKQNKFISSSCYFPWLRILINTQGFAGPCGFAYTKDNVKNKSLKEIWYGKEYEKIREDRMNQILGEYCPLCGDIQANVKIRQKLKEVVK